MNTSHATEDIRILMLEDVATDAELAEQALRDDGMVFTAQRVETEASFTRALLDFQPSIVLADYRLPSYNGREALSYVRKHHPTIPVVMLSGALGDESAVDLLKEGATDYLLKGNLGRLGSAVRHALSERHSIRMQQVAEDALQASELRYRRLFEASKDGILILDAETGKIVDANPFMLELLSNTHGECAGKYLWDIGLSRNKADGEAMFRELQATGDVRYDDLPLQTQTGKQLSVEFVASAYRAGDERVIQCHIRDISERKLAQAIQARQARALLLLSKCNAVLVHANDEQELLDDVCKLAVECGGHMMAWVGLAEHDAHKTVRPVAQSGQEAGYLDSIHVSWADEPIGRGPTGTAIRTGVTAVNQNCQTNPIMAPWREAMIKRGYQSSVALPLTRGATTLGALTIYSAEPYAFGAEEVVLLEELASDLAYGIEVLRMRIAQGKSDDALRQSLEQSIQVIAGTLEARDPYTAGHQRRVADLARAIGAEMGLPDQQLHGLHLAATIHDLGKIHIPAEILSKPGKLTDIEFMLIKTHPQAGYDILKHVTFPWPIADIVLQHHERCDGSGYPLGLQGSAILLEARVIAVADVVEAISSHRPYRTGMGIESALEEITLGRGIRYDAAAVDACLKLFRTQGYTLAL